MSMDARIDGRELTPGVQAKLDELVFLLSLQHYGEGGPPRETTFAEIEAIGHQAGRLLGRAVDEYLTTQHARHFAGEQPCPTCTERCPPQESPHELPLQTCDGEVTLHEPTCRCFSCQRDFFPSADLVGD